MQLVKATLHFIITEAKYDLKQVTHENIGPDDYLAPAVSTDDMQHHQNMTDQQQYTQSHISLQQLPRLNTAASSDRQSQIVQHLPVADVQVYFVDYVPWEFYGEN